MVSGPEKYGSILDFPPSKREYGTAHIKQRCLKSSRFIILLSFHSRYSIRIILSLSLMN